MSQKCLWKMGSLKATEAQVTNFLQRAIDGAFYMVNMLKYKPVVSPEGMSGEELYGEYLNAIQPFLSQAGAEIVWFGKPLGVLIGPDEEIVWDAIFIVRYPDKQTFLRMAQAKGFPSELRDRALADSRLIPSLGG